MADVELINVSKVYGDKHEAVRNVDLHIADGEFLILVGPSGCGKSTVLRMIAGLEDVTDGELRIGGEDVTDRPARARDIAMVFQSYALYPHMTVHDNMCFALKVAKIPKEEIELRVKEAAAMLDLTEHLDRKPGQLSGGQRQRVAMGRAIVREPKAFLMDEPLSNLDAKLRVQIRAQIGLLQQRLGVTTVYVTHDQTEAMTLGDRVAVMRDGVIQQLGSPTDLYQCPENLFVAEFIGSPAMNLVPASIDGGRLTLPFGETALSPTHGLNGASQKLIAGLRPESFEDAALVGGGSPTQLRFQAQIEVLESVGSEIYVHFQPPDGSATGRLESGSAGTAEGLATRLTARLDARSQIREQTSAELTLDATQVHLFDPETGERVG
ncbi:MAG: multiple sugar transport system ATP-binding protein [Solirubrobacteraceae bacterium]|jgi:multiple sugar transport system ATP-binding protein|nr:multiple sugar transport system ATP-binding protein [Solirubrobacteraceae bacterium]